MVQDQDWECRANNADFDSLSIQISHFTILLKSKKMIVKGKVNLIVKTYIYTEVERFMVQNQDREWRTNDADFASSSQ
jgi:hypothetical protein